MTAAVRHVRCREGCRRTLAWLLLVVFLCAAVGPLWAQEGPGDIPSDQPTATGPPPRPAEQEEAVGGLYFHPLGLAYILATGVALVAVLAWVNHDCLQVEQDPNLWVLLLLSLGFLHFLLILVLPNIYAAGIIGFSLFLPALGTYLWVRNTRVPETRQVFTRYWFGLVFRRLMYRLGVTMPPPEPSSQKARNREGVPVVLHQKDGTVRDETQETPAEARALVALKSMLVEAVTYRASAIALEAKQGQVAVRYRIDGVVHSYDPYPAETGVPLMDAVKLVSGIEEGGRRRASRGSFSAEFPTMGKVLDYALTIKRSPEGETVSLEVEDRARRRLGIDELGMSERLQSQVVRLSEGSRGMLLVAGPTGSGKTTTLYAILGNMDVFQRNLMTLESPVEHKLTNVTQVDPKVKKGPEFSEALRSMLRSGPDVCMVSQLADREVAEVALAGASGGCLILSSVEAGDAIGAVFALLGINVSREGLASRLTAILSQRLVRVLCEHCKVPYKPKAELLSRLQVQPTGAGVFYRAAGCEACAGTGFVGRTGIFELMVLNDEIRELIQDQPSQTMLRDAATKAGMVPIYRAGLEKVVQGVTSIKEMLRVIK